MRIIHPPSPLQDREQTNRSQLVADKVDEAHQLFFSFPSTTQAILLEDHKRAAVAPRYKQIFVAATCVLSELGNV